MRATLAALEDPGPYAGHVIDTLARTPDAVLAELWGELGLPEAEFARREDPQLLQRVLAEHDEAIACGATGVPSVRLADNDAVITGAMPFETYQRWVERVRERASG